MADDPIYADIHRDLEMSVEMLARADAGKVVRCPHCGWSEAGGDRAAALAMFRHVADKHPRWFG